LLKNHDGNQFTSDNYRAITLSPVISKLFEMAMLALLGDKLDSDPLQFGFKHNSSCNHAAPAWSGMCSAADRSRLDSILRRRKRLGYCRYDQPAVANLFSTADDDLFYRIKSNSNHVLHPYLPSNTDIPYQLRTRFHRMTLINKTKHLSEPDFIIRLLYKYSY